jgi:hypothetical protein
VNDLILWAFLVGVGVVIGLLLRGTGKGASDARNEAEQKVDKVPDSGLVDGINRHLGVRDNSDPEGGSPI